MSIKSIPSLIFALDARIKMSSDVMSCMHILNAYTGRDWKELVSYTHDLDYNTFPLWNTWDHCCLDMICWRPSSRTKIHDAKDNTLVKLVQGSLLETQVTTDHKQLYPS